MGHCWSATESVDLELGLLVLIVQVAWGLDGGEGSSSELGGAGVAYTLCIHTSSTCNCLGRVGGTVPPLAPRPTLPMGLSPGSIYYCTV